MVGSTRRLLPAVAFVLASASPGYAQGGSQSISGLVVDSGGGILPGAAVVVTRSATGESFALTVNDAGAFALPAISAGTYTVTVALAGFKTAIVHDVRVATGTPARIKVVLEIGTLSETVAVRSGTGLVQTQSAAVAATVSVRQIASLPMASRNALYVAALLPGVESASGPRQSTFSGLPQNTINITIDGISTGNSLQSGDGFFSMVTPRLDAVEEVTVTGANAEATGGRGAVQIAFTTRSGTNRFDQSVYHYLKHPALNANDYFNRINGLDRNRVIVQQYGARSGGPIVIPGWFDGRNRAFYFVNFEHLHQPSEATRTRTILNPQAQRGMFTYDLGIGPSRQPRSVNLLALAGQHQHTATADPTIAAMLAKIRVAAGTTGTIGNPGNLPNTESYVYQASSRSNQYAPTTRVDVNLSRVHRLSGSYWWQRFLSKPDLVNNAEPVFPGFAAESFQTSYRTAGAVALRSSFGSQFVNEARGGWQWSPNDFFGNVHKGMYDDQNGVRFDFPLITDPTAVSHNNPAPRNTVNWSVENTLSRLTGSHSYTLGGSFQQTTHNQHDASVVPTVIFGVNTTGFDPASAMFTTATFQNASSAQLTEARNLYAILTGRITAIQGTARLDAGTGRYVYLGDLFQRSRQNAFAFSVQDAWRVTPALTLNYGIRYDLILPFTVLTDTWSTATLDDVCGVSGIGSGPGGRSCNLFRPGHVPRPGFAPSFDLFPAGTYPYTVDRNNAGPYAGMAWRPAVPRGWLRAILGDPEQATLRAGYGVTYNVERMDRFTDRIGSNPGGSIAADRNYTTGFPLAAAGTGPVLLRERNRLGPPPFAEVPRYPLVATASNSVNVFDERLATPSVHAFSVGLQRSAGSDTAIEIRYVGNRNRAAWTTENWNEPIVFENHFIDEFRLAQANLAAHAAQGCAATGPCSFAYRGPGTGTSPLPIHLGYLQGLPTARAADAAAYTHPNFTSPGFLARFGYFEPNVGGAASALHADLTFRANAIAAGLAPNFFVMNPAVAAANVTRSAAGTRYDSVQIELRRRLSSGLFVEGNYTYARKAGSNLLSLRRERVYLANSSTQQDVPHSFKMHWLYDVPIGRGRRFGSHLHPMIDAMIGGWHFSGVGQLRKTMFSAAGVRVVGMTVEELQDAFRVHVVRSATGSVAVYSMPADIVENTRRAFNTDPTSRTGYGSGGPPAGRYLAPASAHDCVAVYPGDCGVPPQIDILGPVYSRWDMRLTRRIPFARAASVELIVEMQNVFNTPNFNHQFTPGETADAYRVTSAYSDINTTFDPGGRVGQVAWRINW